MVVDKLQVVTTPAYSRSKADYQDFTVVDQNEEQTENEALNYTVAMGLEH